jgi:hypothetical protein
MQPMTKQTAQAFAEALLANHGNATAAARALQYENAKDIGHRYARHPLVLASLAPMATAHLNSLTPKAIQTLNALLTAGSPYVRLEAAKDVLDRNGVGTSREPPKSSQLVVNINLSQSNAAANSDAARVVTTTLLDAVEDEGALENSDPSHSSTSPAHDFSPEPFSPLEVPEMLEGAVKPLDLRLEVPMEDETPEAVPGPDFALLPPVK